VSRREAEKVIERFEGGEGFLSPNMENRRKRRELSKEEICKEKKKNEKGKLLFVFLFLGF